VKYRLSLLYFIGARFAGAFAAFDPCNYSIRAGLLPFQQLIFSSGPLVLTASKQKAPNH
jgi:hypothetical protein